MMNSYKPLTNVWARNRIAEIAGPAARREISKSRWEFNGLIPKRVRSKVWPRHCKMNVESEALVVRAEAQRSVRPTAHAAARLVERSGS